MSGFKTRAFLRPLGLIMLVLAACVCLCACSKDDDVTSDPNRASILVTHDVKDGRAATDSVRRMVYYCYDSRGLRTFGPASLSKAYQVLLQAVPLTSTSIGITYYDSDSNPIGYYSQPVQLKGGEVYEITDPDWEDYDSISNMKSLSILQEDGYRVHTGDSDNLLAVVKFSKDGTEYFQNFTWLCEWKSSDEDVITTSDNDGNALKSGGIKAVSPGEVEITATFGDLTDTCMAEATDATITGLNLEHSTMTISLSETEGAANSAIASWSDGEKSNVDYNCTWSSSQSSYAYAACGMVYPMAVTEAETDASIAASIKGSGDGDSFTSICDVKVVK